MIFKKLLVIGSLCLLGGQTMAMKRAAKDGLPCTPRKKQKDWLPPTPRKKPIFLSDKKQDDFCGVTYDLEQQNFSKISSDINKGEVKVNGFYGNQPLLAGVFDEIIKNTPGQLFVTLKKKDDEKKDQAYKLALEIIQHPQFNGNILYDSHKTFLHHFLGLQGTGTRSNDSTADRNEKNKRIFEQLLPRCKKFINIGDEVSCSTPLSCIAKGTPLLASVGCDRTDETKLWMIDVLCEQGADLNAQNDRGDTALHRCNNTLYAARLALAGASPYVTNNEGATPAECAKNKKMEEVLKPNNFFKLGAKVGRQIMGEMAQIERPLESKSKKPSITPEEAFGAQPIYRQSVTDLVLKRQLFGNNSMIERNKSVDKSNVILALNEWGEL